MKTLVFILIILSFTACNKRESQDPHVYPIGASVKLVDYKLTLDGKTLKNPLKIIKIYPTQEYAYSYYDVEDANGVIWLGLNDRSLKPWK